MGPGWVALFQAVQRSLQCLNRAKLSSSLGAPARSAQLAALLPVLASEGVRLSSKACLHLRLRDAGTAGPQGIQRPRLSSPPLAGQSNEPLDLAHIVSKRQEEEANLLHPSPSSSASAARQRSVEPLQPETFFLTHTVRQ